VTPLEEKLVQHQIRWFVHIKSTSGILKGRENTQRDRERPKLTWEEVVKINFRD
jgi:hypothetical protein